MKPDHHSETALRQASLKPRIILWVVAMVSGSLQLATAEPIDVSPSVSRPLQACEIERFLEHPTSASSDSAGWMHLAEEAATAAFEESGDQLSQSQAELERWLLLIERSPVGNRSQRATLCSRILNRFHRFWIDKEPAAVRDSLGASRSQATTLASTVERESAVFAEGVIRLKLAASAMGDEATVRQEALAELDNFLRKTEVDDGLRRSIISHLARAAYSANAGAIGMSVLGSNWRQHIRSDGCTDTIGAAFFVFWHGTGDRIAAAEVVQLADELVSLGRIPSDHPALRAVHDAYYRGLVNTSDQLLLQAVQAAPLSATATTTTAKSNP